MSNTVSSTSPHPAQLGDRQGTEAPLGPLAVLPAVLFAASMPASMLPGGPIPSPFAAAGSISRYFTDQPDAVLVADLLALGATIALTVVVAVLGARQRRRGTTRGAASVVEVAGASAMSVFALWVLTQPGIADVPGIARALQALSFVVGGV